MSDFPRITVDVHTYSESNNDIQVHVPHIVLAEDRRLVHSNVDNHVTPGLGERISEKNVKQAIHGFNESNGILGGSLLSTARRKSISINRLDHNELSADMVQTGRIQRDNLQPVLRKLSLKPEIECSPTSITILARRGSTRPRTARKVWRYNNRQAYNIKRINS